MGNTAMALLVAVGAAGWVYAKMMKNTGGKTGEVVIFTVATAVIIFVFLRVVLSFLG